VYVPLNTIMYNSHLLHRQWIDRRRHTNIYIYIYPYVSRSKLLPIQLLAYTVLSFISYKSCGLRIGPAATWLLWSRVRIHLRSGISSQVFVGCCVGSCFCYGLVTRSKESYGLCVSNCVWSTLIWIEAA